MGLLAPNWLINQGKSGLPPCVRTTKVLPLVVFSESTWLSVVIESEFRE